MPMNQRRPCLYVPGHAFRLPPRRLTGGRETACRHPIPLYYPKSPCTEGYLHKDGANVVSTAVLFTAAVPTQAAKQHGQYYLGAVDRYSSHDRSGSCGPLRNCLSFPNLSNFWEAKSLCFLIGGGSGAWSQCTSAGCLSAQKRMPSAACF